MYQNLGSYSRQTYDKLPTRTIIDGKNYFTKSGMARFIIFIASNPE